MNGRQPKFEIPFRESSSRVIFRNATAVFSYAAGRVEFRNVRESDAIARNSIANWKRKKKFDDDDACEFDFLISIFACATGSDEKKPASLERVEELAGKTVDFHNVDISDVEALDKIFKLVSRWKSLFDECKRSRFHLFFYLVSIRLRHSFGRPEIGWRFLQFAAQLLPE